MKYGRLLISCLLLGCMNSCKQKDTPYYPITDQRLRDAVNIKPGSYFVYLDSVTNITDSFTVITYDKRDYHEPNCDCTYEEISYVAEDNAPFPAGNISVGAHTSFLNGSVHYLNGIFDAVNYAELPFKAGTSSGTSSIQHEYIAYYPTYLILGKTYTDVYAVKTTGLNQGATEYILYSWYSLQSGLIRFTTSNSNGYHVWQLIRSKILH